MFTVLVPEERNRVVVKLGRLYCISWKVKVWASRCVTSVVFLMPSCVLINER